MQMSTESFQNCESYDKKTQGHGVCITLSGITDLCLNHLRLFQVVQNSCTLPLPFEVFLHVYQTHIIFWN